MSTNRRADIRYRTLDQCFRDTKRLYKFEDLCEACNRALEEEAGLSGVTDRQIYVDINFMKSDAGWGIELDDKLKDGKWKYYRYKDTDFSIANQGLNKEEIKQIRNTVFMLSKFRGLPSYGWIEELMANLEGRLNIEEDTINVIGFDQNKDLKGLNYLTTVLEAAMKHQVLDIVYKANSGIKHWTIHCYYVKQYNNRWYLFGLNDRFSDITCVALDRIEKLRENSEVEYRPNKDINFEHYFDDIIGVTLPKETENEIVVLKFSAQRFPMVLSKPLHHTQKIVESQEHTISIYVKPNKELEQQIFSFGIDVEILSPQHLRDDFAKKIEEINKKYFN